jgi:hypothetical protein
VRAAPSSQVASTDMACGSWGPHAAVDGYSGSTLRSIRGCHLVLELWRIILRKVTSHVTTGRSMGRRQSAATPARRAQSTGQCLQRPLIAFDR